MSFPAYDEYKDSCSGWLGNIPSNWKVIALKHIVSLKSGDGITGESIQDTGEYPVYGGNGLRGFTDDFNHEGHYVVVGRQGALCGNVNYANGRFWASEHAVVASPLKSVDTIWLGEMLRAMNLNQYSVSAAQPGLSMESVGNLRTVFPPLAEQRAISSFLDVETSKIDGLVSEQRRLIELLKEKRQAVISHAVTKGLNPNAPMKPSGTPWLGEVPQHWKLERGRYLYKERLLPPELDDGVVTSFRDGQVTLRTNRRTDGFTMAVLEVGYQRVMKGDLVIHGMDAFAGAIGVSESTGKCSPEYSILVPTRDGINNEYFAKLLRLMALRNYIYVICPSVRERAPRFRFTSFKNVWLPLPPIEEQDAIVEFILSKSTEFDVLAAEAERAIELLQERRTALISAAVTGKIDVRQFASKEVLA